MTNTTELAYKEPKGLQMARRAEAVSFGALHDYMISIIHHSVIGCHRKHRPIVFEVSS